MEDSVQQMKNVQAEVEAALHKARDDMKCYADRSHADAPKYQIGDRESVVEYQGFTYIVTIPKIN